MNSSQCCGTPFFGLWLPRLHLKDTGYSNKVCQLQNLSQHFLLKNFNAFYWPTGILLLLYLYSVVCRFLVYASMTCWHAVLLQFNPFLHTGTVAWTWDRAVFKARSHSRYVRVRLPKYLYSPQRNILTKRWQNLTKRTVCYHFYLFGLQERDLSYWPS